MCASQIPRAATIRSHFGFGNRSVFDSDKVDGTRLVMNVTKEKGSKEFIVKVYQ